MQEDYAADESAVRAPVRLITELLSAHDVARLTRRPRCVLWGLALIGRFPREARYRERTVGWRRSDVLECMARGLVLKEDRVSPGISTASPRQRDLPLQDRAPDMATQGER